MKYFFQAIVFQQKQKSPKSQSNLGINSNALLALFTVVSEQFFVTLDAVWVFLSLDVPVSSQRHVTVEACEVACVEVLIHGFCVLSREDQLKTQRKKTVKTPVLNKINKDVQYQMQYHALPQKLSPQTILITCSLKPEQKFGHEK